MSLYRVWKGIFGLRNLTKILCEIRENAKYLARGAQPRPQGFSLKKWVGRDKALASAGHVYSLNIPEKLIYMQPAGLAPENNNIANYVDIFACVRFKSLRSIQLRIIQMRVFERAYRLYVVTYKICQMLQS